MGNKSKTQSIILSILLATTFFPTSERFNIIKIVVVLILCIYNKSNYTRSFASQTWKQIISLWFVSILLATVGVLLCEGVLNQSIFIHEVSRLVYYALVIFLCTRLQVTIKFLFYCCSIILGIHFVIQVTQYLHLGTFNHFIEQYYLSNNVDNIHYQFAIKSYYTFRSGSIFINPNVYVCYPYLSLAIFLDYNRRVKSILPLIMIIVAFLSIVLTGSRMGLMAFMIIIGWYSFFRPKNLTSNNKQKGKTAIFVLAIILVLIFNWNKVISFADGMRAFNLDDAYAGSGSTKLNGFIYYLSHTNPLYWLTGSLGSNSLNIQIDMEMGYIFAWFGIIGIIWYVKLLKMVYHNNGSEFKVISTIATLSILLTAIGASSVLNMSVFPYICAISLTTIRTK